MAEKPSYDDLEKQIEQLKIKEAEFSQKEIALRESEQKYQKLSNMLRLMCDNVPDMIWAKDLEKRFIFANKAICSHLLNATDSYEPIGKTDLFFAERERSRFPDNPDWHTFGEICRDSDQITMEAGVPMQFDEFGNVKGQFLFLDVHKAPFLDENGKMIGIVGSARNITEHKKAEKALQESEEHYRILFEHTNEALFVAQNGNIIFPNPRTTELSGYSVEELQSKAFIDFIHEDDREMVMDRHMLSLRIFG